MCLIDPVVIKENISLTQPWLEQQFCVGTFPSLKEGGKGNYCDFWFCFY